MTPTPPGQPVALATPWRPVDLDQAAEPIEWTACPCCRFSARDTPALVEHLNGHITHINDQLARDLDDLTRIADALTLAARQDPT